MTWTKSSSPTKLPEVNNSKDSGRCLDVATAKTVFAAVQIVVAAVETVFAVVQSVVAAVQTMFRDRSRATRTHLSKVGSEQR